MYVYRKHTYTYIYIYTYMIYIPYIHICISTITTKTYNTTPNTILTSTKLYNHIQTTYTI